ncbi:neuronal acetylcholine receptor subunit alpha-5-like [Argonauta hians]
MYNLSLLGVFIYIGFLVDSSNGQDFSTNTRLYREIFKNYNKDIVPIPKKDPINVEVGFDVHQIDLDEYNNKFKINGFFYKFWTDFRMKWDPEEYDGRTMIRVPAKLIWTPDVVLYNFADPPAHFDEYDTAVVGNDGKITYVPRFIESSVCIPDISKFPFDIHKCFLKFGSWVYGGNILNLTLRNFESSYENKKWEIRLMKEEIIEKVYSCCPETYQHYGMTFEVKRKQTYFLDVLAFPVVILSILVPFLFLLSPDTKERITLGVVLILGCLIEINQIMNKLPVQPINTPIITIYLYYTLLWLTMSIVFSTFVMNMHNRGAKTSRMPKLLRYIFLGPIRCLVCVSDSNEGSAKEKGIVSMNGDNTVITDISTCSEKPSGEEDDTKNHLRRLANIGSHMEANHEIVSEWQRAALVFDRILFVLFFLSFLITTVCILG